MSTDTKSPGDAELRIVDDAAEQRYEARLGERLVGYSEYRLVRDGRLILFHTEVDPAMEGRGIGSRLAVGLLADIRRRGLTITVKCPFIAAYLKRHHEYDDLIAADRPPADR